MDLRQSKCGVAFLFLAVFFLAAASGQTQDNSGNGLLSGKFAFRHVAVQNVDSNFDPSQITASYGTIAFDGKGNYTIAGTSVDNTVSNGAPQALSVTGTYAIGSNGAGYIANPLYPTDSNRYVYGAVSQGVYAGSSTESFGGGAIMNDIFVAILLGTAPTNASFTSSYQTGVLDFTGAGATAIKNALFKLSPDGKGGFGTISLNGQASNQLTSTVTQSVTGATYSFNSDGSATLTIPVPSSFSATDALFTGSKTVYESADGNFILGWTASGYDIFFGVKALAVTGTNSTSKGLYFTAALEDSSGINGTDSFYGAISSFGDSAGDAVVHERLNVITNSFDFGTDDQITLNSDGTTGVDLNSYQYSFGDAGLAFVGMGTQGNYSLIVGLHAAAFSGTGVYLNPVGVVNAASYQPITASLAPGELIALTGTGLYSGSGLAVAPAGAFPTTLGGVSVSIDNIPCAIYYVSATQIAVTVPYGVASNMTGLANIQVTNNGAKSNVVQMYLTDSAPGAFSQSVNGIGFAAALHAATGALITSGNPVQPGEYISLFLTGLGPVSPTVQDGALGPSSPLSIADVYNAGNLSVFFNDYGANGSAGNQGTIQFAGLAPSLAGLYQINVQVPTDGLASGDNVYIEFVTDAANVNQIQIPFGSAGGINAVAQTRARASLIRRIHSQVRKQATHRVRRGG